MGIGSLLRQYKTTRRPDAVPSVAMIDRHSTALTRGSKHLVPSSRSLKYQGASSILHPTQTAASDMSSTPRKQVVPVVHLRQLAIRQILKIKAEKLKYLLFIRFAVTGSSK